MTDPSKLPAHTAQRVPNRNALPMPASLTQLAVDAE